MNRQGVRVHFQNRSKETHRSVRLDGFQFCWFKLRRRRQRRCSGAGLGGSFRSGGCFFLGHCGSCDARISRQERLNPTRRPCVINPKAPRCDARPMGDRFVTFRFRQSLRWLWARAGSAGQVPHVTWLARKPVAGSAPYIVSLSLSFFQAPLLSFIRSSVPSRNQTQGLDAHKQTDGQKRPPTMADLKPITVSCCPNAYLNPECWANLNVLSLRFSSRSTCS